MDSIGRHFALPYYLLWALQDPDNMVANTLAYALENSYYTDELLLNAAQQRALLNIDSPWQAAFEHLNQILSDANILPDKK